MQDRYKFRVWDFETKKYVYYDGLWNNLPPHHFVNGIITPDHEISEPELCTGLKAEKSYRGTGHDDLLIYEGDRFITEVLLSPDGISSAHNISLWVKVGCVVRYFNGSFVGKWKIKSTKYCGYTFSNRSGFVELNGEIEIISNPHDKPKPLES